MALRKGTRLVFCLLLLNGIESRWTISEEEDLEFEKQLRILNKPPVKTFRSPSGLLYDCIDVHKQPAFDNPLLKDHKIQMWPSTLPTRTGNRSMRVDTNIRKDTKCPSGTVLIRRVQKIDLMHGKYVTRSFKRHVTNSQPQSGLNDGSHYAVLKSNIGEYYGARARLVVYGLPNVELDQSSVSQIWVIGGENGPEDRVNTVQAGWHVYPSQNDGDSLTHLSTFWTADGYKTGCWNLNCLGFVTLSPDFGPGSEITELSTVGGIQEAIELMIFKDPKTGNWWLTYGKENSHVGYWPKELFNNLDKANEIDWGGAVSSPFSKPSPPMGSGHIPFDDEGRNQSCTFTDIQLIDNRNMLYDPTDNIVDLFADLPNYYDIQGDYRSAYPYFHKFPYGPGGWFIRKLRYGGPGGWFIKQ